VARAVVTRNLPGTALDRIGAAGHDLAVWPEPRPPTAGELRELVADAEGLLCLLTDRIDEDLLAAAPNLRAISNYAVGTDNIDLSGARARGIPVGVTAGVLTDATADLAFALILASARRLAEGEAMVRDGAWGIWQPGEFLGRDVAGTTVAIIGPGRIGEAVATRAQAFAMQILRVRRGDELAPALAEADFVSLHAPYGAETHHLIDEAALRAMKPTAILVNTARGGLVDQAALKRALEEGWIAGAALDVTTPEPLPADDPLLAAPNLLVVPHIGSATHRTRERMAELAVDNLLAGLAGTPLPHAAP
jgi:glyoxylate reductase